MINVTECRKFPHSFVTLITFITFDYCLSFPVVPDEDLPELVWPVLLPGPLLPEPGVPVWLAPVVPVNSELPEPLVPLVLPYNDEVEPEVPEPEVPERVEDAPSLFTRILFWTC